MRVGDFSVEVLAADGGAREVESGHVLARPGQVYTLRLRNHGPLRAVADISIDGNTVTRAGLVLNPWSTVDLERPIHETERGRFTVIAEGNERVFGPDGGRDNPDLGLIEARFRRELPVNRPRSVTRRTGLPPDFYPTPADPRHPEQTPPMTWSRALGGESRGIRGPMDSDSNHTITALFAAPTPAPVTEPAFGSPIDPAFSHDAIERAAGTGLTGSSSQEFVPVHVGTLESEATVVRLRLVIGSEEALSAARPLPRSDGPARPAARP